MDKELSGEHKDGSVVYKIHPKVYNNSHTKSILHPNATKENIDKALNDEEAYVRREAIKHPNATKEHIDKALNDEDADVRKIAKDRSNNVTESKTTLKSLRCLLR